MKTERILYFDILNIIACISVIFLHCNGIAHYYTNTLAWKEALGIEVICYFAVPIFVMITGANLMNYKDKYGTKTFFKKRFIKVFIPYFIWSFIYFNYYTKTFNFSLFINRFLYCKIENIFWFFPMILFMYTIIPVITHLTREKDYSTLKYIAIIIFIFQSVLVPFCTVFKVEYPTLVSHFNGTLAYLIFIILGYLLSNVDIKKNKRIIIYVLAIICLCTRYIYTYHFSMELGYTNKDLFNYTSVISVIPACAIFLVFKNINFSKLKKHDKLIAKISSCSFGIYLIHLLLKNIVTEKFNMDIYALKYRLLFPMILYFTCLLIVLFIKKIPIIKRIVP